MSFDFVRMCELFEERKKVVSEIGRPLVVSRQGDPEPRNNDGRRHCWWCWQWTERKQGFTATYDICPKCGK